MLPGCHRGSKDRIKWVSHLLGGLRTPHVSCCPIPPADTPPRPATTQGELRRTVSCSPRFPAGSAKRRPNNSARPRAVGSLSPFVAPGMAVCQWICKFGASDLSAICQFPLEGIGRMNPSRLRLSRLVPSSQARPRRGRQRRAARGALARAADGPPPAPRDAGWRRLLQPLPAAGLLLTLLALLGYWGVTRRAPSARRSCSPRTRSPPGQS